MKKSILTIFAVLLTGILVFAQEKDTTSVQQSSTPDTSKVSNTGYSWGDGWQNYRSSGRKSDFNYWAFSQERWERKRFNEIGLSYGFLSLFQNKVFRSSYEGYVLKGIKPSGNLSLVYMYYLPGKITAFGAIAGYEHFDYQYAPEENENGVTETRSCHFIVVAPMFRLVWFNLPHFGMYSQLAIGALAAISDDQKNYALAFQVDPMGVEAGGERLRGFAEFGYGTIGNLVKVGVKYSF